MSAYTQPTFLSHLDTADAAVASRRGALNPVCSTECAAKILRSRPGEYAEYVTTQSYEKMWITSCIHCSWCARSIGVPADGACSVHDTGCPVIDYGKTVLAATTITIVGRRRGFALTMPEIDSLVATMGVIADRNRQARLEAERNGTEPPAPMSMLTVLEQLGYDTP